MNYNEAINWIHSIGRFGINPGLVRMEALLEMLGRPHHKLKIIHIGGTNGKGSTAAFTASILQAAGYRVGLYTSPYLEEFNNRISINGEDISRENLVQEVETVRPLVDRVAADSQLGQPTEFEVVTTIALNYYSRQQPDYVVMEVGLGGRLDATNIVKPVVTAITNVSLDHTDVLGDTLDKIAGEKAGIIKELVPLVTAVEEGPPGNVIYQVAKDKKAPVCQVLPYTSLGPEEIIKTVRYQRERVDARGQYINLWGKEGKKYQELFIPLRGSYQAINAATALAILENINDQEFQIKEEHIRSGFCSTRWPGRMEIIKESPLVVMDGAHNPSAMKSLAQALPDYFNYNRLVLLLGIMEDKDISGILKEIVPLADEIILTSPTLPRAAKPELLYKMVSLLTSCPVLTENNLNNALNIAITRASSKDMILVTGSLYTVSEARKKLT